MAQPSQSSPIPSCLRRKRLPKLSTTKVGGRPSPQHDCPLAPHAVPADLACTCVRACTCTPSSPPLHTTSAKVNLAIRQMTQAPRRAMYDSGGGGRDLTLERPDEEINTKVQRPRSPPFRLPALPSARPSTRPPFHPPARPPNRAPAHHHSPLPSRKLCDESRSCTTTGDGRAACRGRTPRPPRAQGHRASR